MRIDTFEQLQIQLAEQSLIIVGEAHDLRSSDSVHYELFTELANQNFDNYLLLEYGESYAYLLNRYLQTGKERYLDAVLGNAGSKRYARNSYRRNFLKLIREKQLESSQKRPYVIIKGVDLERHSTSMVINALVDILEYGDSSFEKQVTEVVTVMKRISSFNEHRKRKHLHQYLAQPELEEVLTTTSQKSSDQTIREILNGLKEFSRVKKWNLVRDQFMYERIQSLYQFHNVRMAYYQVGLFHTMYNEYHETLATLIKNDSALNAQTLFGKIEYLDAQSNCPSYADISKGEREMLLSNWSKLRPNVKKTPALIVSTNEEEVDIRIYVRECP